jgi:hypothetical protein
MFFKLRRRLVVWILLVTSLSLGIAHAHWFYPHLAIPMEDDYADEVVETPLMFDLPPEMRMHLNEGFWVLAVECQPHQCPLINHRVG